MVTGSCQLPYSQTLEKSENTCYVQTHTKKFYNIDTCWRFHKHLTQSCTIVHNMPAPMQCMQNELAYFVTSVSYECKMFMTLQEISYCVCLWQAILF